MATGNEPIQREVGETKGRYFVVIDGVEAELTYSRVSDSMIIVDHTEVPDALRGQKVGVRLVQRVVEDARAEGVSIIPLCPFTKAQIERHVEWQDVVNKD